MRSHHHDDPHHPRLLTRRQLLVAGAVTGVPLAVWLRSGGGSGDPPRAAAPAPAGATTTSTTTAPPAPPPTPPSSQPAPPALDHDLVHGMTERSVELLQARLHELAFDPGPVDGYFGGATLRSVWAFQKLLLGVPRDEASGVVTPAVWAKLHEPVGIAPRRSPGGTHLEVYLPEQVAVLYDRGAPRVVSHVSSGQGIEWCDEVVVDNEDGTQEKVGICGLSITPGGVYHFERKVEGWRNAKLGRLYKPVYFNFGIAIHGATNVPNYPASRGCVRFPMHIAEYLQDLVSIGDAVFVFDGVEEPETYGAQPMIFDWPDPDYTTTTSSTTTTTTTTTTTVPPTTTPPATTAPAPPPATTQPTTTITTTTPTTTVPASIAPTSTVSS